MKKPSLKRDAAIKLPNGTKVTPKTRAEAEAFLKGLDTMPRDIQWPNFDDGDRGIVSDG